MSPSKQTWRWAAALFVVFCCAPIGSAAEFYVSPNGSAEGTGNTESPWDLQTAISQSDIVRPGDTIWLRGGVYRSAVTEGFVSRLNGTEAQPIIIRNYNGERATLDGLGTQFTLAVYGSYTWFWGLEIMDSNPQRVSTVPGSGGQPGAYGVAVYAPGVKCINMIVHDTAQGISAYNASPDSEFYGNLVYYNGWFAPDRQHGHGLYMQNIKGTKVLADNFVGDNFDEGMQIYGSGEATVQGFRLRGNSLYNTSSLPGLEYQYNLLIAGGGTRRDIQVQNNYSYFTPERDYGFVNLGQYTPGDDMLVTDNVFVGGYNAVSVQGQAGPLTFTGNKLYTRPSAVRLVDLQMESGQTLSKYTWDNNKYFGLNRFFFGRNIDFSSWKAATGFDSSSTFTPGAPTGIWIYVRPNQYEDKRANVTIYNWDLASSVAVDLSGILVPGDNFVIRDAQNFFGPVVTGGTYAGEKVLIPMTGLAKSTPVGVKGPAHTAPQFGTFVVMPAEQSPEYQVEKTAIPRAKTPRPRQRYSR